MTDYNFVFVLINVLLLLANLIIFIGVCVVGAHRRADREALKWAPMLHFGQPTKAHWEPAPAPTKEGTPTV